MKNAKRNMSYNKLKKKHRNSQIDGSWEVTTIKKNKNLQQQIEELKKQVKLLNRTQIRKYFEDKIEFGQLNQSLMEI